VVNAIENRSNPRDPEAEAWSVRGIQSRSIGLLARRSLAAMLLSHPRTAAIIPRSIPPIGMCDDSGGVMVGSCHGIA
jgi:hypothetical protein